MMKTLLTAAMFYSVVPLFATSYYPARLNDAKAIYLTPDNFPVKGDGIAHYAQHCFLAHMDFQIGSGLAGIHDGGNVAQDVHFYGGQYGIWTRKPSPGWQFTVIDATFEGQREAAIREHEAGLTLIRPQFKNVPTAISIDPEYSDELWVKDGRMENVTGPAVIISNEKSARTEINMENVVCRNVPVFAAYRVSG